MAIETIFLRKHRRTGFEILESRELLDSSGILAADVAEGEGELKPDFSLVDVNSNSATFNQHFSPREFLDKVSVWYFIHST